jgi:GNAT superfamily N-acetyltransferase
MILPRYTIRGARPEDAEDVRTLMAQLGYGELDPPTFIAGFGRVLSASNQSVWVAIDEQAHVVGMVSLSKRDQIRLAAPILSIDELVVADAVRGAGIGRLLLDQVKREAARFNARHIELHTRRSRASYRRAFYTKNGFIELDAAVMRLNGAGRPATQS